MQNFDVIIIGAGAAGLMCAGVAGQRGLRVALIDHAEPVAEKIRISGGGRCNFTNIGTSFEQFVSANPRFAKFALAEYTAQNFITLLESHGVTWHEKHKGQLFCDGSSQQVIDVLLAECTKGRVQRMQPVQVLGISSQSSAYIVSTSQGVLHAANLVIATGGLSIPKIGATDFGYKIAEQFGVAMEPTVPALVPLTMAPQDWVGLQDMAGVAVPVVVSVKSKYQKLAKFDEDLLFTHKGLSGPAALQISSYWDPGQALGIALVDDGAQFLAQLIGNAPAKSQERRQLDTVLAESLPKRLVQGLMEHHLWSELSKRPVNTLTDAQIRLVIEKLLRWQVVPNGSEGYRKAEVTRGGVSTTDLDQRTMQVKRQAGLHFIGEVVDMTGWLGGYNFQWAWSSAYVCAQGLRQISPN